MTPDRETIMEYVLGHLSPQEAAEVQRALERDPALYAEWQADQDALMLLVDDLDLSDVRVPDDAEVKLLEKVRVSAAPPVSALPVSAPAAPVPAAPVPSSAPQSMPLRTWLPILLAVAAVGLVAFWTRPAPDDLSRYAGTSGAVSQTVQVAGQAPARIVRLPDGRVFVRMDQAAQAGKTYQLWELRGATPVSLGTFERDYLSQALPRTAQIAVSVEPPGGSPQPTTTPLFLQRL